MTCEGELVSGLDAGRCSPDSQHTPPPQRAERSLVGFLRWDVLSQCVHSEVQAQTKVFIVAAFTVLSQ